MQLSRKGWNNVIIFSMLIMIFFLNGWHKNIGGNNNEPVLQPVLPIQSFVLTLSFVDQKIERIGTSWRTTALQIDVPLTWQGTEQQLGELVNVWQSAQLMSVHESVVFNPNAPLSVATFELAGEPLPWVYLLYKGDGQYYLLEKNSQRVFALDLAVVKQLFPSSTPSEQ
ncbi:hypothetical protein RB215_02355 [Pseudoalteromonas sp. HL-AS2]|uniref:hypothetical protein n=1 Tax=unclassified Pseudoalteromonas TaxID=194690 RepID=UPI0015F9C9BE|nr:MULTISPECIES: hypothetical protein [unclassified Pseudoalteromonas]MBB1372620.1 hypothetical protein [Pseudoalteromonas sp. SR45-4]WMS94937.1 hypothetical protein RB215_02355 [Pseudoalteromonas sp. HL-AS2]